MIKNTWDFNLDPYIRHVPIPPVCTVIQKFPSSSIVDLEAHLAPQYLAALDPMVLQGKRIAITVGSRGIEGLINCLRPLVDLLKKQGAFPFIFPAMGSHAGATAQGQKEYLHSLGITEHILGVPVLSDMDTVVIDTLEDGTPVYCDQFAAAADGIIVINKIKPHSNFKGDIESGLCKMMVIGMGKREGAAQLHAMGYQVFSKLLAAMAERILKTTNILFAVGIVENSYGAIMLAEVIAKDEIIVRERELLKLAKRNIPRIQTEQIDVLIVDQIGKNISGQGMDPNVTGRTGSPIKEGFNESFIDRIVVLGLTPETHGNFVGLGMSDISTSNAVHDLDFETTYINEITSRTLPPARLPLIAGNDEQAIKLAIYACQAYPTGDIGIVHIQDTNHIKRIEVSNKILRQMSPDVYSFPQKHQPHWREMEFNAGYLKPLW